MIRALNNNVVIIQTEQQIVSSGLMVEESRHENKIVSVGEKVPNLEVGDIVLIDTQIKTWFHEKQEYIIIPYESVVAKV